MQDAYKTGGRYGHGMFTLCCSNWRTKHESSADTEEDMRWVVVVGRRYCEDPVGTTFTKGRAGGG